MNIFRAYKLFWKNYVNFHGRASRSEYWFSALINVVILILLMMISLIFLFSGLVAIPFSGDVTTVNSLATGSMVFIVIYVLFCLAVLLPSLSCSVRRLHDTGKSGHFIWLCLIPWVGGIIMLVLLAMPSVKTDKYGFQDEEFDI
ncbi:DUF805 domain-containing protein [Listeria costaricensis]|uniref:DUF805 domain-containing protein n=1 Tax=Listeria costaricensis TaxID=2026604 RepID=UPI000C07436A|nr:DUF805 domain-containing protein [Listeria costaricensis]